MTVATPKVQDPPLHYRHWASPLGLLLLYGTDQSLWGLGFPVDGQAREPASGWIRDRSGFSEVIRQLTEYFARQRRRFALPLTLTGTPFQMAVWSALEKIPYGETRSYRDVARAIRRPRAMRAVGAANGNNPIPIIIPCHRVIGAHGDLVGFGGGLTLKRTLLELEGIRMKTSRNTSGSVEVVSQP